MIENRVKNPNLDFVAEWLVATGLVGRRKKVEEPKTNGMPEWMKDPRALKVESYQTKEEFVREVSRIVAENRKGSESERISPYELIFNKNGEPDFKYEKDSILGKAEYEGMMNMRELAMNGEKYIIWLSVPGGRSSYNEGRMVVGIVKECSDDRVVIECRGIPVLKDQEAIKKMADQLKSKGAVQIGSCLTPEDLREEPLGVKCKSDDEFWKQCQDVFGVEEVWEAIKQGKDIKVKDMVESWLGELWDEMQKQRAGAGIHSRGESIYWGRWLENQIRMRGIEMVGGNHGAMNREVGRNKTSAFGSIFQRSEIGFKVETTADGRLICPCGEILNEGVTKCPKCGLKLALA